MFSKLHIYSHFKYSLLINVNKTKLIASDGIGVAYSPEHSNSGKKSFDSIRFRNLINLPLVHRYSNSKLGVIFIVCIA